MEINFKEIAETYVFQEKTILDKVPNAAAKISAFKSVPVCELDKDSLKRFEQLNVLYFFKIINHSDEMTESIRSEVQGIKNGKETDLKLPLVNKEFNNSILYVGKSSGKFNVRLNQHLFADFKSTYALHLSEWKNDALKLELHYTSVDLSEFIDNEVRKAFLEKLETVLHSHLKPILGRTGH